MKTNEQIMADLQGSVHANKTIFRADVSQTNPLVIIVIFTDGTQANVSSLIN
jgi:hypothetical protein